MSYDHRHFVDALRGFLRLAPLYCEPESVSPFAVPLESGCRQLGPRGASTGQSVRQQTRTAFYEQRLFVARNSRANHRMD